MDTGKRSRGESRSLNRFRAVSGRAGLAEAMRPRSPAVEEAFSLGSSALEQVYVASGGQTEHAAVLTIEL
jgi:hypothetical protein